MDIQHKFIYCFNNHLGMKYKKRSRCPYSRTDQSKKYHAWYYEHVTKKGKKSRKRGRKR